MTDPSPLTAEQIAELRKLLDKSVPDTSTKEQLYWHAIWRNRVLKYLPALLALAERSSNGEADTRAKSLEVYADGVAKMAEASKTDDGWLKALAGALRDTAALLRKLSAGESGEWEPTHRHYKGGLYRVIARGLIEADLTPCVVYDKEEGETWVRPAEEFDGEVNTPDGWFIRFVPLPEPPQ